MQNLTTYSCSLTPISYMGDEISRLSRLVIEIPILAIWGFWVFLGYLATSSAKSDVIFLLGDPDFLYRRRNFAPISLSYRDPQFDYLGVLGFGGPPNVVGLGKTFLHFPLSTSLMNTCMNHHCILLLGAEM